MPTCPNGHEVDALARFCRQCGASMTPLAQSADATPRTTVVPPHPAATAPAPTSEPSQPSNTAVYVLAGVIVLVGLIGIGIALILGSGGDNTGRPTPAGGQTVQTTPTAGGSPSAGQPSASASVAALPSGATKCPVGGPGSSTVGTIGSETSCGFAQAVDAAYIDQWGLNVPVGARRTVSATSPATGKRYTNIVCTSGEVWVTCVGGNHNTAHLFFSPP